MPLRFPYRLLLAFLFFAAVFPMRGQLPLYGDFAIHDPSTLIKEASRYYTFGTGDGIRILSSSDLRNWTASQVFSTPPAWTTVAVPAFAGTFWAPDIAYFNGKYHLYYAVSTFGTIDSAIGLVTTTSLQTPVWTDQGKVVQSDAASEAGPDTDFTQYNCIDPSILVDTDGKVWMIFGSYSDGIVVVQLDPATGKRLNNVQTRIANNGPGFFTNTTEGAFVYKHDGYYYLLLNFGGCCSGVDSTYNIRVGRSASIAGPYLDKNGVSMVSGGGTVLFESTGKYVGPGHAGIFNDNGTFWLSYHYYQGNTATGWPALLGIQELKWAADGWPALTLDSSALYTFDTDAREHMALHDGSLLNGAKTVAEPGRGKVLSLDGSSQYAMLPQAVGNASTFAAWVKWNGGGDWQRIFDFGTGTNNYLFLTPRASNGRMRFAIRNGGSERILDAPSALPANTWNHVAVTLDGTSAVLYLNGAAVSNAAITIRPWRVMEPGDAGIGVGANPPIPRYNYVGKSQFPADPYFSGQIDSVRMFHRALSASEIAEIASAPSSLAHRYSFTGDGRDSVGMAHGVLKGNAVITNGALQLNGSAGTCMNLPGGLVSGASAVTIESWATFGTNGNWARLLDFGDISGAGGFDYLFFSPHSGVNSSRLSFSTPGGFQNLDASGTLDNTTVHVVTIADPINGYTATYVNGVRQAEFYGAVPALNGVSSAWSFLGRSLFSADAWLNATVDELRIYDGRLTPQEIAANYAAGPNVIVTPGVGVKISSPAVSPVTVTGTPMWLRLSATVLNNGASAPSAAVAWSRVSGPATVSFANASAADTLAQFSGPGTYVLQCQGVVGSGSATTQITVTVNAPSDPALALWMKLNESSGTTATDSSGNGNTGSVSGTLTWQPAGGAVAGTALFDGTSSYINVPDANSLDVANAFTLGFWLRANSFNSGGLVSKRNSSTGSNAFTTYLDNNRFFTAEIDGSNNRFTSRTAFTTGAWYHAVLVFDGSLIAAERAKLYINGVLDRTATESSSTIANYSSSLKLGLRHTGDTNWFNGDLDDVRLYRRALSFGEISALANANFTPVISTGTAPAPASAIAANLAGSVTNELSGAVTGNWSKVSGPGSVTFGDPAVAITSVTFSQAGAYVLRLTGGNSVGEISSDLTLTVAANSNVYLDWISLSYPGVTDAAIVGAAADPDHDGVRNDLEWALGLDPTKSDAAAWEPGKAGLPVQKWETVGGAEFLAFRVRRPIGRIGVTYSAEVGGIPGTWSPSNRIDPPVANGDGTEIVTFLDTVSRSAASRRFIRLKLTAP